MPFIRKHHFFKKEFSFFIPIFVYFDTFPFNDILDNFEMKVLRTTKSPKGGRGEEKGANLSINVNLKLNKNTKVRLAVQKLLKNVGFILCQKSYLPNTVIPLVNTFLDVIH